MLEKPNIPDEKLINCVEDNYGMRITELTFLPLGADVNTAVYRAGVDAGTPYFVKLRSGDFDDMSVRVPRFLYEKGVRAVVAPILTQSEDLWANLDFYKIIVYPYIEGHNGFEVDLTDQQWVKFGTALKQIHSVDIPFDLRSQINHENHSPYWREMVSDFQQQVETKTFAEPVAARLANFLKSKREVVSHLLKRAEDLAAALQAQPLDFVLCHSDIHVGNLILDDRDNVYMVDWDNPILAPKERDLMFVGGGVGGSTRSQQEEERLFYEGYGQTEINPIALAYYRYERIVQDIAAYCQQLLLTVEGGADRENGLRQLTNQFEPNQVIEIAYQTEKLLPPALQSPITL